MSTTPSSTQAEPYALATLSPTGKPPASRLSNATQARSLFDKLRQDALPRLQRAAVMQGMFDGNAPYDGSKLRARNEGWRPNFSTQEGGSRKDSAKTPFYDLITSAETFAECGTDIGRDGVDAATATRVRSEEFDRLLRTYEDFEDEWYGVFDDMIAFNRGFFWFPDPNPGMWHFQHVPWHRVYFPDNTSVKRRRWNFFAIEHAWTVHELYSFVANEREAADSGWNLRTVHAAIRSAAPATLTGDGLDPMAMQRALADSELFTSESSQVVRAASLYVQEFDGSWSRMVVVVRDGDGKTEPPQGPTSVVEQGQKIPGPPGKTPTGGEKPSRKDDWLYYRKNVAKRVTQILCPFVYETNNGTINSLKGGLGPRILPIMQAKDRMRCEQVSNVLLRSSIVLQPLNASSRAKTGLLQFGPITVLPDGYTVQQGSIFGDIEGSLAVNADLDRMVDVTTGTYRAQFEKPTGNPETATAAQQRVAMGVQLSDAAVRRFYVRADTFYYELFERIRDGSLPDSEDPQIQSAREFHNRCRNRGLDKRQIEDCVKARTRASRTVGNGSPVMRQQMLGSVSVLAMQGMLGPRGMKAWKTMFVAAFLGQAGVQALLPKEDDAQVPTRDDWDATVEEADSQSGATVLIAPWQNHALHALHHMQFMDEAIKSVEQGGDPSLPFTVLTVLLPHTQQHVQAASPEAVRKQLENLFKQLAQRAKVVEQAAQQMQQQQQQASQLSFEQQLKQQETMGKLQLSQAKMEGTMQLKAQRQQFDTQLKAQQAGQDAALKDATTGAAVQRDAISTSTDIALQQATAASDINIAQRKADAEIENQRRKAEAQAAAARNKPKPSGGAK